MVKKKFPNLVHVVWDGEDDNPFMAVYEDGVVSVDVPNTPIAIYQLVSVGTVSIVKSFQEAPKKRKART